MKKLYAIFAFTIITLGLSGQKEIFDNAHKVGGDVILNKLYNVIDEAAGLGLSIFEITAPVEADYYMSTWISVPTKYGFLCNYLVQLNGAYLPDSLYPQEYCTAWQTVSYKDKSYRFVPVKLKAGFNTIGFASKLSQIPNVTIVKLTLNKDSSYISDTTYKRYIQSIKDNTFYYNNPGDTIMYVEKIFGKSTIPENEFEIPDNEILNYAESGLTPEQKDLLQKKYEALTAIWWKGYNLICIDPPRNLEGSDYMQFVNYCRSLGTASWPFVFRKFESGDLFALEVIKDLTLSKYQVVLDSIKNAINSLPPDSIKESNSSICAITLKYMKSVMKTEFYADYLSLNSADQGDEYEVYPNYTSSVININCNVISTANLEIINAEGCSVLTGILSGSTNYTLDISGLLQGMYFVKISDSRGTITKKVVKQ